MKFFFIEILVGSMLFLSACSKSTAISAINGPALNIPPSEPDGLMIPVTKGSSWQYQRIDSFLITYRGLASNIYEVDTTQELVTLIGDTLVTSIDPQKKALFLLIENQSRGTKDTNFIYYSSSRFCLYAHTITESDVYTTLGGAQIPLILPLKPNLFTGPSWDKIIPLPLPVKNFRRDPSALLTGADTTYITKDSSITINGINYTGSVYAEYSNFAISFAASGVGGFSKDYYAFFKPGTGILYEKITPATTQGSPLSAPYIYMQGSYWITRRLVGYSIK